MVTEVSEEQVLGYAHGWTCHCGEVVHNNEPIYRATKDGEYFSEEPGHDRIYGCTNCARKQGLIW